MGKSGSKLNKKTLQELLENTNFSEEEIKQLYKGFHRDCPTGKVTLKEFKYIYGRFFPSGNADDFAKHVFRTFDTNKDGYVDFSEFLRAVSMTSRGSVEDKLRWTFGMYDLDKDGFITRDEMLNILEAIYDMMGSEVIDSLPPEERSPAKRRDKIFELLDHNDDHIITLEEFLEGAQRDKALVDVLTNGIFDKKKLDSAAASYGPSQGWRLSPDPVVPVDGKDKIVTRHRRQRRIPHHTPPEPEGTAE
ncbi:neuronal calcium sensor 1-like isoform X1 [Branchiostoma lanceolatum]|uniref:neuronal calcium sensor 1-like isoform X1 n=1 Tax=Branchiostoma lanceolatum TaxID=7740 RepID=UPI0034516244